MARGEEPWVPTVRSAAAAVRAGETTAEELLRACFEAVDARDGAVRAWAHIDRDAAVAQARARDAEAPRGALHGVPVGVKDIIDVAGLPAERGSPVFAGRFPERDAAAVAEVEAAGAVVLGKTVTTELALFQPAVTTNPHDPRRTPGGSSSGSAAAVAAGMVPMALGTQTAGSVVRPAAFCGIAGFKPSHGVVPLDGVQVVAESLDTLGVFTRDVADLALAVGGLVGGADRFAPPTSPVRLGVAATPWWSALEAGAQDVLHGAFERLVIDGIASWCELPAHFGELVDAQATVMAVEAAAELGPLRRVHGDTLSELLRDALDAGAKIPPGSYREALAVGQRGREEFPDVLGHLDALLVPAVLGEAPAIATTGDPLPCRAWTLLGAPSVAVPGLVGPGGLPLGVQVVAPAGRDAEALAAAAEVERRLAPRDR